MPASKATMLPLCSHDAPHIPKRSHTFPRCSHGQGLVLGFYIYSFCLFLLLLLTPHTLLLHYHLKHKKRQELQLLNDRLHHQLGQCSLCRFRFEIVLEIGNWNFPSTQLCMNQLTCRELAQIRDALTTTSNTKANVSQYTILGNLEGAQFEDVGASLEQATCGFLITLIACLVVLASYIMFIRCRFIQRVAKTWRCEMPI